MKSIYCIHPTINNVEKLVSYLCIEKEAWVKYLEWDSDDPTYVIVTEFIYKDQKSFSTFRKLFKDKDRRIFLFQGGEAVYPDLNIFDYSISFSRQVTCDDRHARIPTCYFFRRSLREGTFQNNLSYNDAIALYKERKFCNFIYSNPDSHYMRDYLFKKVSEYKKVDSLGGHLNNTGVIPTRRSSNWAELSIQQKEEYRFSISSENESFEGYISEKLLTTFQAHSVPIYWGDPSVSEEFNEEAFINAGKYSKIEELVEYIKEVDSNPDLWARIASSPWQKYDQMRSSEYEYQKYLQFMSNIFNSDISIAKRVPSGTFTNKYIKWYFRQFNQQTHFISDWYRIIKRKIKIYIKHYFGKR